MATKTQKKKREIFQPGTLIVHKYTGRPAIMMYTYAQRYGGKDNSSLHLMWLPWQGQPAHESSWHNAKDFTKAQD